MTYEAKETSAYGGSPVELYEFRHGPVTYRYTSGDDAITYLGQVYSPASIRRPRIEQGQELNRSELVLNVPRDLSVADLFRIYPPTEVVLLTIRRQHRNDSETAIVWQGRLLNVTWRDSEADLSCEPVGTSLRRTGLRRKFGRQCPHMLYGVACRVNQLSYKTSGEVTAIAGNTVSVAAFAGHADGWFDGGVIEVLRADGVLDRRMIRSHIGDTVTVSAAFVDLAVGASVDAYPGCDHSLATCDAKYSNSENYGGWPFSPGSSPFGGKTVF